MLKRLKEYKEFLAILIFFSGGIFWIYTIFVTQDQLKFTQNQLENTQNVLQGQLEKTQCLLRTNVDLLDHQIRMRMLAEQIRTLRDEINNLQEIDANLANYRKEERKIKIDRLIHLRSQTDTIEGYLRTDGCSQR